MSTYAKAAERRNFIIFHESGSTANRAGVQANLQTGTISNYTTGSGTVNNSFISNIGNGWYRCIAIGTASAVTGVYFNISNTATQLAYSGDGTSGIYLWGAQLEAGSFATSYIPTVASQVTRAADVAVMTGTNFSSWYNQSEGTILSQGISNSLVNSTYWSLRGTGSNEIGRAHV